MFHHKGKSIYAAVTGSNRIMSGMPQILNQARLKIAVTKENKKVDRHFPLGFAFIYMFILRLKIPKIKKFLFYF